MKQELFLQREELVQEYQLGDLQKEYTGRFGKLLAIWVFSTFLGIIVIYVDYASLDIAVTIYGSIVLALLAGTVLARSIYYCRRLHVYVYTGGLIYINENKRIAVRWEQINKVIRGRVNLGVGRSVSVVWGGSNEQMLSLTPLIDGISMLYSTIKREVDDQHSSGKVGG